jgi:hypothetical protein
MTKPTEKYCKYVPKQIVVILESKKTIRSWPKSMLLSIAIIVFDALHTNSLLHSLKSHYSRPILLIWILSFNLNTLTIFPLLNSLANHILVSIL